MASASTSRLSSARTRWRTRGLAADPDRLAPFRARICDELDRSQDRRVQDRVVLDELKRIAVRGKHELRQVVRPEARKVGELEDLADRPHGGGGLDRSRFAASSGRPTSRYVAVVQPSLTG